MPEPFQEKKKEKQNTYTAVLRGQLHRDDGLLCGRLIPALPVAPLRLAGEHVGLGVLLVVHVGVEYRNVMGYSRVAVFRTGTFLFRLSVRFGGKTREKKKKRKRRREKEEKKGEGKLE